MKMIGIYFQLTFSTSQSRAPLSTKVTRENRLFVARMTIFTLFFLYIFINKINSFDVISAKNLPLYAESRGTDV